MCRQFAALTIEQMDPDNFMQAGHLDLASGLIRNRLE